MANTSEILKDKRVIIGGSVAGLLLIGVAVVFATGAFSGGSAPADDSAPAPTPPTKVTTPVTPTTAGGQPTAGITGKPVGRTPGTPSATITPTQAPRRTDDRTSFADAPPGYGGTTGTTPGAPAPPVAIPPTTNGPTDTKIGDADANNKTKVQFAPFIQAGVSAPGARRDPFVSFRFFPPERPAAYNFLAPLRLASQPQPPKPPASDNPELEFGPLPFVPRRVAGILHNGSVSAILETGSAGASDVKIVQPGDKVDSGIAGVDQLTVASITATQVTLRADDGRTVSVQLTGSAAAAAAAQGGGGPGVPGGPGGFGGRGGGGRGGGAAVD